MHAIHPDHATIITRNEASNRRESLDGRWKTKLLFRVKRLIKDGIANELHTHIHQT